MDNCATLSVYDGAKVTRTIRRVSVDDHVAIVAFGEARLQSFFECEICIVDYDEAFAFPGEGQGSGPGTPDVRHRGSRGCAAKPNHGCHGWVPVFA